VFEGGAADQNLPLAGIRVIDLGQVYQGPYATFLMAKAGAEVIKVEPPGGDALRLRAEVGGGAMLPFEMLNANKRSITLNLKSANGRGLLQDLVRTADVLVENFAPGVMDRLGVGWEKLHAINPRLVYGSGTGFGLSGPDRDNLAMDITIQAVSGAMSVTGMEDGPPVRAGPAIADFLGGIHLYAAVLTALVERGRTGRGRLVEVAMQETVFPTLASSLGMAYETGEAPKRTGNRHSGLAVAPYNVYPTRDGFVAIIALREIHWDAVLNLIGREDLRGDLRFQSNATRSAHMDETDALISAWTQERDSAEVFTLAKQARVPCAPVRELMEVWHDPHMLERGMLEWVDHPRLGRVVLPNSPLRIHGADRVAQIPAPELGEHTASVLAGTLGLSDAEIAELRSAQAI